MLTKNKNQKENHVCIRWKSQSKKILLFRPLPNCEVSKKIKILKSRALTQNLISMCTLKQHYTQKCHNHIVDLFLIRTANLLKMAKIHFV